MGPHAPAIPPRNKNRPVYTGASPEITVFAPTQSPLQASTSPIHARSPTQDASPPAILCSAPPNATVPQTVDIPQSASSLQDASHIPPPCGLPIPSPNLSETTRDENAFSRMSVRSLRFSDDRGSLSDSSQSSLQQGASTWQRLGGSFEGRSRVPEGAYTIYAPAPPSVVRSIPRQSSRSRTSGSTSDQDGSSIMTKSSTASGIMNDHTDPGDTNALSTQSSLPLYFERQVPSPSRSFGSSEAKAPVSLASSPTDISLPSQPPLPTRPVPPTPAPPSTESVPTTSPHSNAETRPDLTNKKKEKRLFFLNLPKRNSESRLRDLLGSKKEPHNVSSTTSITKETLLTKESMPPSPKSVPVSAPPGSVSEDETLVASRRLAFAPALANSPWAPSEVMHAQHESNASALEVVQVTPPKFKETRHAFDAQSPSKLPTEAWSFAPSASAAQAGHDAELDERRMPWAVSESPWPVDNNVPFELEEVETVQPVTSLPILSHAESAAQEAEVPKDLPEVPPPETNDISETTEASRVTPKTVETNNEVPANTKENANIIPSKVTQEPNDLPAPAAGEVPTSKDTHEETTHNAVTQTDANAHEATMPERTADGALPDSSACSATDAFATEQAPKDQAKEDSTLEHLAETIPPASTAGIAAESVGLNASEEVDKSDVSDTGKQTEKEAAPNGVSEAKTMSNPQDATVTLQTGSAQADQTCESPSGALPPKCVPCDSTTETPVHSAPDIQPPMAPEQTEAVPKPCLVIEYCDRCRWMHRAIWLQTELLITFSEKGALDNDAPKASGGGYLASSMLVPQAKPETAGRFRVWLVLANAVDLIWDRKTHGGFPELRELKNRVRDKIAPRRHLGHSELASRG